MSVLSMYYEFNVRQTKFFIYLVINNKVEDTIHIDFVDMRDCPTERIVNYYMTYYLKWRNEIRSILTKIINEIKERIYT